MTVYRHLSDERQDESKWFKINVILDSDIAKCSIQMQALWLIRSDKMCSDTNLRPMRLYIVKLLLFKSAFKPK